MTHHRVNLRRTVALAAVVLALGAVAMAAPATTVDASPAQQAENCTWNNLGNASGQFMYVGSALDTDQNKLYVFGGANTNYEAQNSLEVGDFSGATLGVSHKGVSISGAQKAIGAAGAYRAKGDSADSAAYFIGGLSDKDDAGASTEVQRYLTKAGQWERVTGVGGSFAARAFAAAAYDPDHDVIWVTGGIGSCELGKVLPHNNTQGTPQTPEDCNAKQIATQYLSFDPTTGAPTWNTLSGSTVNLYGHTMVYDSIGKRMILFGGTKDIRGGEDDLMVLNLSDPDPSKATLGNLGSGGTAPKVAFHGASFDAAKNRMVVTGGVRANHMASGESTESRTYVLDLGGTAPTWSNLVTYRDRVGGAMAYLPNHMVSVYTLGRSKASDPTSPKIDRKTDALVCAAAPTATTPVPTTPTTTTTATSVTPSATTPPPTIPPQPEECAFLARKGIPAQARSDALNNPGSVYGYQMLCNPNVPASPYNVVRNRLSMQNAHKPFHPMFNPLVWSCGCP